MIVFSDLDLDSLLRVAHRTHMAPGWSGPAHTFYVKVVICEACLQLTLFSYRGR